MTVSRRRALAIAAGTSALLVPGVAAEAKPPPGKGKPRVRTLALSDSGLGVDVRTIRLTVGTPPPSFQSAVALTPVDGEIISGSTQSNFQGNGYYTRRGLTRAANWTGPNPVGGSFAGFDDPAFLPIATWLTDPSGLTTTQAYDRMDDLGLNGMLPMSGSSIISFADNLARGKWAVVDSGDHAGGTISSTYDPVVLGVSTGEEPSSTADVDNVVAAAAAWLGTSDGPGRFHLFNFSAPLLNQGVGVYPPSQLVDASPLQFTTCDAYWNAGSTSGMGFHLHFYLYSDAWGSSGAATAAQCARGSNYGSMLDSIRKCYDSDAVSPSLPWIEAGAPFTEASSQAISPAIMKWAVWSTLVHGARGIAYFVHNFRTGDTWGHAFWDNHFGGPGITGTGIYAAAKEVNLNALTIAPAINSPFDGYFVYGDTDTAGNLNVPGFLTSVTSTNSRSKYGGVDASCRWLPTTNKHYILATTREQDGTTNWPVTFRMVDQGQTTAVRLFDTTGNITITRGGSIPVGFCEFADTFATAASYKAYRID